LNEIDFRDDGGFVDSSRGCTDGAIIIDFSQIPTGTAAYAGIF